MTTPKQGSLFNPGQEPVEIAIQSLTLDPEVRARAEWANPAAVRHYASIIKECLERKEALTFPAISCVQDEQGLIYVPDGILRVLAYQACGLNKIPAILRKGSKRDAILQAVGSNTNHGLQRSSGDIRRATEILLNDPQWSTMSNPAICKYVGCSETYIRKIKKEKEKDGYIASAYVTYQDKDGNVKFMLNKGLAIQKAKEAEETRKAAIIPKLDDLTKVLTLAITELKDVTESTRRNFILKIKIQLESILVGENPFQVAEVKEEFKVPGVEQTQKSMSV